MSTYLVVEDGSGVDGANGYVSMDTCAAYAAAHGLTFGASPSVTGEQAIIRASAALDARYQSRFLGYRTYGRDQSFEWPRTAAYDTEGYALPSGEIPIEVQNAVCEMAVRELAEAGSTNPDLSRDAYARRVKAGSVEIEYGANAGPSTIFPVIDGILAPLLGSSATPYAGTAVRG